MWLEKSYLSVLKTHWSAGTDVHLNRNKTNYKSSLGMGLVLQVMTKGKSLLT